MSGQYTRGARLQRRRESRNDAVRACITAYSFIPVFANMAQPVLWLSLYSNSRCGHRGEKRVTDAGILLSWQQLRSPAFKHQLILLLAKNFCQKACETNLILSIHTGLVGL